MTDKLKTTSPQPDRSRRSRSLPLARKLGFVTLALVFLYLVLVSIAPFLISSSLVRNSMESAVARWTGHAVSIAGVPEITFWPEPRVTLSQVSISRKIEGAPQVIGRIERLSARFGLYDAVLGQPVFRDFSFLKPEVFITRGADGRLDWSNQGLLSAAVRGVDTGDGDRQSLNAELDARVGKITVQDGTVEIADANGRRLRLSGLSAEISWPRLSEELKGVVRAEMAGHAVSIDLSTRQPLLLLGGRSASTRATITADVASATFEGLANLADGYFLSGALQIDVSDIPALIGWTGAQLPEMDLLKQGSLQAQLTTIGDSLRFGDLKFALNDISGSGILELSRTKGGKPRIGGTLAFDRMDIGALLGAFSLHLPASGEGLGDKGHGLLDDFDFDLTLSARQAALQPFVLEDVAASVLNRNGKASFDIADSRFEGGRLTGHLDGSGAGFEEGGNLRISAKDADLQSIAKRLQLTGPLPDSRGSIELLMHSPKPLWATRLGDIGGSFQLRTSEGSLSDIDLSGIRNLAGERAYFRLSDAGDGEIDFKTLEILAKFANGTAEIEQAELITDSQRLSLSGVIPYASNSLALLGQLSPVDATATGSDSQPLRFFIGGSWPDPILSSILAPPEKM
ncbi:AsmA-like C-terminal region-containing protein [Rhizobium sp. RU36D]|uniref:AsmA family protein n=1 Tax=Rhizobium sp. RU36D TaxID=1907415 RepID=UPI0009D8E27D|nr:AsmA-like C-terminal region-containing protein [Rhizobium sp. RU36D]SMC84448.1 AsmA protein [Rhizobium sp. RU36D]